MCWIIKIAFSPNPQFSMIISDKRQLFSRIRYYYEKKANVIQETRENHFLNCNEKESPVRSIAAIYYLIFWTENILRLLLLLQTLIFHIKRESQKNWKIESSWSWCVSVSVSVCGHRIKKFDLIELYSKLNCSSWLSLCFPLVPGANFFSPFPSWSWWRGSWFNDWQKKE